MHKDVSLLGDAQNRGAQKRRRRNWAGANERKSSDIDLLQHGRVGNGRRALDNQRILFALAS
jgi:hypothetical protein